MIELKVGYFDSRNLAESSDLGDYDEILTFGFHFKNDGGGGHYKRYSDLSDAPPLGFPDGEDPDAAIWGP